MRLIHREKPLLNAVKSMGDWITKGTKDFVEDVKTKEENHDYLYGYMKTKRLGFMARQMPGVSDNYVAVYYVYLDEKYNRPKDIEIIGRFDEEDHKIISRTDWTLERNSSGEGTNMSNQYMIGESSNISHLETGHGVDLTKDEILEDFKRIAKYLGANAIFDLQFDRDKYIYSGKLGLVDNGDGFKASGDELEERLSEVSELINGQINKRKYIHRAVIAISLVLSFFVMYMGMKEENLILVIMPLIVSSMIIYFTKDRKHLIMNLKKDDS